MELYGGAGVGKTELLLHLASCAILPTCHHGDQTSSSTSPGQRHHQGNQTQVVWVDCDLKFSVLRLAVLLEQRVVKNELSGQRRGQGRGEGHVCGEDGDADSGEEREVRTAGVGQNDPRLDNSVSTSTGSVCDMQRTAHCGQGASPCHMASCRQSQRTGGSGLKRKAKEMELEEGGTCLEPQEQSHRLPSQSNLTKAGDGVGDKLGNGHISAHQPHSSGVLVRRQSEGIHRLSSEKQTEWIQRHSSEKQTEGSPRPSSERQSGGSPRLSSERESGGSPRPSSERESGGSPRPSSERQSGGSPRPSTLKEGGSEQTQARAVQDDSAGERSGEVSAEEVEKKVAECLGRVLVVRCLSSQQLICTLRSLESTIAANPHIALLVVDPVSAFFWSDRCRDFQHSSSFLHKHMSYVAAILKRIADSYGVLVVTTKQALIKPRPPDRTHSVSPCEEFGTGAGTDRHVEFLGQAWSEAVTHRFVCCRSVKCQGGQKMAGYTLSGDTGTRHFTISESGVTFEQTSSVD